jgi:hypothetical protein
MDCDAAIRETYVLLALVYRMSNLIMKLAKGKCLDKCHVNWHANLYDTCSKSCNALNTPKGKWVELYNSSGAQVVDSLEAAFE